MGLTDRLSGFSRRIHMIGFGSIGQGALPLLLKHIEIPPDRISITTGCQGGRPLAERFGVGFRHLPLTRENFTAAFSELREGDFVVNTSNDVSSVDLIRLCRERGALYADTCIEPWAGGYHDHSLAPAARSNYALREAALALNRQASPFGTPTAVLTHGANPGLVSHFVKRAIQTIAKDCDLHFDAPASRQDWGRLAQRLGIRTIHIAERDTQVAEPRKRPGEFVNTWSVEGFIGEGCQPAELGWGSHERHFPPDGRRHTTGCQAAIYLNRPGASVRVRTWTPKAGPILGFLITHGESISLADYLTLGDPRNPVYRPTVHYAYHPCDDAVLSLHELAGRAWSLQEQVRLVKDEIVSGDDELGVLLMGHPKGAYWYGSRLSIAAARAAAPSNGATSLQVTAPLVASVVWGIQHPQEGVVDPEHLPHDEIIDFCGPYLGELSGAYSDWTPLHDRSRLFPEEIDRDDPWQFLNFRVD